MATQQNDRKNQQRAPQRERERERDGDGDLPQSAMDYKDAGLLRDWAFGGDEAARRRRRVGPETTTSVGTPEPHSHYCLQRFSSRHPAPIFLSFFGWLINLS